MGVNIMFISYWSLNEPLTSSTILPYMEILEDNPNVSSIMLVTVEHDNKGIVPDMERLNKLTHLPLMFSSYPAGPWSKAKFFLTAPKLLAKKVEELDIHIIDSKASIAGLLAHKVSKLTGKPYYVESFEPHSEYMRQSGNWNAWQPFYLYNKYYEKVQIKHANKIITVTHNYKNFLVKGGVDPERVIVVPSITQLDKFKPDAQLNAQWRAKLAIPEDAIVGIYVGKFGGMYLKDEAYELMRYAREKFGERYHQIVLTPQEPEHIIHQFLSRGFNRKQLTVQLAAHDDVPKFLACADFAFTPFNQMRVGAFLSPVKNGEYWAAGLPVILTDGISDDYWIIREAGLGGALYDVNEPSMRAAVEEIAKQLEDPDRKMKIRNLAIKYRSIEIAREAYKDLFNPKNFGLNN